ncbi:hypothetical protein COLO4_36665 [Corchorus olitorius]|uniref:1-phosphatidylinositol-4-phosphate 5-kinase n=1 Tax=Corchorus olitorius TaxID=93759 RepID=A0A1R3G6Y7_9ROSI|nr:hypothetical protein COLO4_36665 [Corchorus olitorius]
MNKEQSGVLRAWEATIRKTQAAKKRANSIFGTMSLTNAADEEPEDDNDKSVSISGEAYFAEKVLANGDYYTGQWYDNLPNGQGKYLWTDGCMYLGEWHRGKTMGRGRFSWPSGATYEGEFKSGYMDGTGAYTGSNGDTYKGKWVMNLKHGHGIKNYSNGDCYDGEWRRGLQEGQGKYQWKNGDHYIGEWKNGVICGKGTFVWGNGNKYDGFWDDGMPKGNGTYQWPDGSFYVGNWSKDPDEQNGTYYPSESSLAANLEWDPKDVYEELGNSKICPGERVSIMPSQKKLAIWYSTKGGDKPRRMSVDGRVRFIIMGNLLRSEYTIHRRFDLKGSSLGRITEKPESEMDDTTILKDLDLNFIFKLQKAWFQEFCRQIDKDCEFLEQERTMDYSLLVGNSESTESCPRLNRSDTDQLLLDPKRWASIRLGGNMPAQVERTIRKPELELQLVGEPTGECYEVVMFFGIIDILQDYDITKKLEHAYKSIHYDPTSISAVDPKQYSKRFRDFIFKVFAEDSSS